MKIGMVAGEVETFDGDVTEFRALREIMSPPRLIARADVDPAAHREEAVEVIAYAMARSSSMPGDTAKQIYEALFAQGLFR